jgi:hypothetical protein
LKRQPKRRFLGLTVNEVSAVDVAANEADFVVLKNQEENDMTNKSGSAAPNAAEVVTVDDGASEAHPDVTKALEHVSNIVAEIAKMAGATPAAPAPAATAEETEAEKAKKKAPPFGKKEDEEEDMGKKPAVAKSAEPVAMTPEAVMGVFADAVQKAKQFTPERVAKLQEAFDTLKLLLENVAMGSVPATSTPPLKTSPGSAVPAEGTTKALDEITKALGSVVTQLATVTKEVEAIKSAKPAPAGEGESGTVVKTKKNSSIWSARILARGRSGRRLLVPARELRRRFHGQHWQRRGFANCRAGNDDS